MDLTSDLQQKLVNIKILFMDVDGTLTDGKIHLNGEKEIYKSFNVKDGYMIKKCREHDILTVILTGLTSDIVSARAKTLKINDVYQGITNKSIILQKVIKKYDLTALETAYIGDDLNDLDCLNLSGFSACPCDASNSVINAVDYVCSKKGGDGAVRELIDLIIEAKAIKEK